MSFDLTGKTAIVTGAAGGIGRAVAERLAAHGARVAALDIKTPDQASPGELPFFQCDVSDENSLSAAINLAAGAISDRDEPKLDILVNNAGLTRLGGDICEMNTDYFDQMMAVNTRSVMLGAKHGASLMGHGGSIINTASLAAFIHEAGAAAYHASKAAVVSLTRAAAIELGPRGIRVNAVCPGHTRVPHAVSDAATWKILEQLCQTMAPMGRLAEIDDQTGAFHFLAADESRFMTGQALVIDGGFGLGLTPALYDRLGANGDA